MPIRIYIDQGHNPVNPNAGADYFISLHTNASDSSYATGSEAFVYRRNSAAESLADSILTELGYAAGLPNRGVIARPGLYVLRRTRMPAVLAEMGFITGPADAELMAYSPQLFAAGVSNSVLAYLGLG